MSDPSSALDERPRAARDWALAKAAPAMTAPPGFQYPRLAWGDWRSRRQATAALACAWTQQGMDELARLGLLQSGHLPRPVFDAEAWDETAKESSRPEDTYGALKLGRAVCRFWPSNARTMHWEAMESRAPSLGSPAFAEHWRLRAGSALFGRFAMGLAAKKASRELLSRWLDQELEAGVCGRGPAAPLASAWEASQISQSAPSRAARAPSRSL